MKSSLDPDDTIQNNNGSKNKRSLVHEYFIYDGKNDVSNCKTCTASIKGRNTTNLENHLKIRKHIKKEYLQFLKDKENTALSCNPKRIAKAKAASLLQPTLPQVKFYRRILSCINSTHTIFSSHF